MPRAQRSRSQKHKLHCVLNIGLSDNKPQKRQVFDVITWADQDERESWCSITFFISLRFLLISWMFSTFSFLSCMYCPSILLPLFYHAWVSRKFMVFPICIACVASVSVWFRSKERPWNGILGFGRARNETRAKKWKWGEALLLTLFSRGLWLSFLVLCYLTARKRLLRRLYL